MVDPDGVYRAYLADGTIVDAARLTSEQVQTFVDARAPHLSEEDAAEELKPKKYLQMFPDYSSCIRDTGPGVRKAIRVV